MLACAGIDITVYRAHSIRAASTSKAWNAGEPLQEILATAGWSNKNTFAKYHKKTIRKPTTDGKIGTKFAALKDTNNKGQKID